MEFKISSIENAKGEPLPNAHPSVITGIGNPERLITNIIQFGVQPGQVSKRPDHDASFEVFPGFKKSPYKIENARLKAQVPKWHDITKPLYTEDGVDYYDLPAEYGWYIVDLGDETCTYSEYDPDDNDWCNLLCTTKVFRWCEFPTTEESSAAVKEKG